MADLVNKDSVLTSGTLATKSSVLQPKAPAIVPTPLLAVQQKTATTANVSTGAKLQQAVSPLPGIDQAVNAAAKFVDAVANAVTAGKPPTVLGPTPIKVAPTVSKAVISPTPLLIVNRPAATLSPEAQATPDVSEEWSPGAQWVPEDMAPPGTEPYPIPHPAQPVASQGIFGSIPTWAWLVGGGGLLWWLLKRKG